MDDKVYTPEVIDEALYPSDLTTPVATVQTNSNKDVLTPNTTKEQGFPTKKVAVELLSSALNTRSKKVLQNFNLEQSGGFQVGNYQEGISGDLRITPNGLTARDQSGATTFAIDGETGDATFKGEIRAGSIITEGQIVNANGTVIVDEQGLISSANFRTGSVTDATQNTTTSTSYTDVPSMTLTFTLDRDANVLFMCSLNASNQNFVDSVCLVIFNLDGSQVGGLISIPGDRQYDGVTSANKYSNGSSQIIRQLTSGSHTIKLQYKVGSGGGTADISAQEKFLGYVVLGV